MDSTMEEIGVASDVLRAVVGFFPGVKRMYLKPLFVELGYPPAVRLVNGMIMQVGGYETDANFLAAGDVTFWQRF